MDARVAAGVSTEKNCRGELAVDFDLIGNHCAVFVSHRFDLGDGESAIA
jgi:hypothetical protein